MDTMRKWLTLALLAVFIAIQGCGGGGGASAPAATQGTNTVAGAPPNVQPISVNAGLAGTVNLAFTSVTLCVPGSNNCQTIDNIVVDTGSSGLRIMSSVLAPSLSLQQQTQANGDPVVECAHFAGGFIWGPVKRADLTISGEHATSLPIQVIGDPQFTMVPTRCSSTGGLPIRSVSDLGANGILGLGVFRQDCGNACAQFVLLNTIYYTCPAAGCQLALTPVTLQVQQPVSMFAIDNNGVIIELPQVPAAGAAGVSGSLVFGIGTQANNGLGAATVIGVDPSTANFTTIFNGTTDRASFMDSGSNALFFTDAGTPVCTDPSTAGFFCPVATQNLSATIQGSNGRSAPVNFSLANATTLVTSNPGFTAFSNLGAPAISFDWGLPFFYGRNVYTAIEGAPTPGGPGPYIAF
jgi:hypothetical protein